MRNLAKRVTSLEKVCGLEVAKPTKRLLPQWLLDDLHEQTGLPFDTDEQALESVRRLQDPKFIPIHGEHEPNSVKLPE